MRLGRLVAAGLILGAAAGFAGALLRPRTVRTYGADTGRAAGSSAEPFDTPGAADGAVADGAAAGAVRVVDVDGLTAGPGRDDGNDAEAAERRVVAAARSGGAHG